MRAAARPRILVLAGVNGAGKSSVGGTALRNAGLGWFNPDTYTRELEARLGLAPREANALAWEDGRRRLEQAIAQGRNHALETTLGGQTLAGMLERAADTHDVVVWYCGLDSLALHLQRVRQRVAAGGHDIDPVRIAQRHVASPLNLIRLMPRLARLAVYDNSASVATGEAVPDPLLVLRCVDRRVLHPQGLAALEATPAWARPLVERALQLHEASTR